MQPQNLEIPIVDSTPVLSTSNVQTMNLASEINRILAFIIDVVIISIIAFLMSFVGILFSSGLGAVATPNYSSSPFNYPALTSLTAVSVISVIISLISLAIAAAYYLYIPSKVWIGQTVGKKILNIKIVSSEDGGPVGLQTLAKRYGVDLAINLPVVGGIISCVYFIVLLVNLVLLFTDEKRQTLFDKLANTVVVNA